MVLSSNKKKTAKQSVQSSMKVPKSVQDTIPYVRRFLAIMAATL